MKDSTTKFGRRDAMQMLLLAGVAVPAADALAQGQPAAAIPRGDILIATGQPSGGAPTFAQHNDFNPFHPGLDLRSSVALVLEPLYFYNVLSDQMIPWLAEGYEYNAEYTSITVRLRRGIAWNDGTPFTADDPIHTIDMLRQNGLGKSDQLYASALARDIRALVRIDDHSFRIELNQPNPRWFFTYLTVRFT
jgi:peptide/nickel transport system substrate-binding protein